MYINELLRYTNEGRKALEGGFKYNFEVNTNFKTSRRERSVHSLNKHH